MAIVRKTLNFSAQTPQEPWVSIPSGWSKVAGSDNARIMNRAPTVWELYGSGTTAVLRDDTILSGRYRVAEVMTASFASMSSSAGAALINSSGSGYCVVTNSSANNYRIFAVVNGQMNTTVLWTSTGATFQPNTRIRLIYDDVDKKYRVYVGGTQVFATGSVEFTSSTYTPIYAAALSRFGWLTELSSEYETAQSIDTLTSPLVMGGAYSIATTGFSNGSATLSFSGVSATHTLANGAGAGTLPSFSDNLLCPFLPATNVTVTHTQGGNSATIQRPIAVQAGFRELRDANDNPSNFANLVTDDDKYLYKLLADAGFIINTADRCYFPTAYGLIISPDGGIQINSVDHPTNPIPGYPFVATLYVHKGADSRLYEVALTINKYTDIPGLPGDTKTILKAVVKSILGTIIH